VLFHSLLVRSLLSIVFALGTEMYHINKKNNRYVIAASIATLFIFAIITAISNIANTTPAAATTTTTTSNATTTTSSSEIELSAEPVHQERQMLVSENPINETHSQFTFSGNGTLNLPNSTGTINITTTGSVIAAMDGTAVGEEVLTTDDGSESATAKFYAIGRVNMEDGSGRSIIIALVTTNSTGQLAPLNGAIVAGQIEFLPDQTGLVTLWEWQSGIPLPTSTTTAMEVPPQMNTTTTMRANATTTTTPTDTNATTAGIPEEGGIEDQEQQQTTQTTAPNPLFE
jgi:hypothetical protein